MRDESKATGAPPPAFALAGIAAMGTFWVASFLLEYLTVLVAVSGSDYLKGYWASQFPPSPVSARAAMWYGTTLVRLPFDVLRVRDWPAWLTLTTQVASGLCMVLVACGLVKLWRKERAFAGMLLATAAVVFAAAATHHYPLLGRLMLFALPIWLVPAAVCVAACFQGARNWSKALGQAIAALVLGCALLGAGMTTLSPPKGPDTRHVMNYLAANAQAGDTIYTLGTTVAPLKYYLKTGYPELSRKCVVRFGYETPWLKRDGGDEVDEYFTVSPHGRVWVIFSDLWEASLIEQRDRVVTRFKQRARLLDRRVGTQTEIDLFDVP
jgi:hypothetical protein